EGGVDQRHVAEGLREVALLAARLGFVLLGEQAEVVADGEQALEQYLGILTPADLDPGVAQPEAAGQEGAFARFQAVVDLLGVVAPHEAVDQKLALDRLDRADEARIVGLHEADRCEQEQARVELVAAVGGAEGIALSVEALVADLGGDAVAY